MASAVANDVSDFTKKTYRFKGKRKTVLRIGQVGPAVIVVHEIYGFTPTLARFCRWIAGAGFQVYAPILYGRPEASDADMISAATRAEALEFIAGLRDAKGRSGAIRV